MKLEKLFKKLESCFNIENKTEKQTSTKKEKLLLKLEEKIKNKKIKIKKIKNEEKKSQLKDEVIILKKLLKKYNL